MSEKAYLTLHELAERHMNASHKRESLLRELYYAIKDEKLMINKADHPSITDLVSKVGVEIGAENA